MKIVLNNNIFSIHDALRKQEVGNKPIPAYADNFMETIDKEIITFSQNTKLRWRST